MRSNKVGFIDDCCGRARPVDRWRLLLPPTPVPDPLGLTILPLRLLGIAVLVPHAQKFERLDAAPGGPFSVLAVLLETLLLLASDAPDLELETLSTWSFKAEVLPRRLGSGVTALLPPAGGVSLSAGGRGSITNPATRSRTCTPTVVRARHGESKKPARSLTIFSS